MMGMNQETLLQQLAPSAKQQATFEAIIDEIVAIENLETSDEANQQVEGIAAHNQVSKEDVLNQIDIESLKRDLNRIKASRLIMDNTVFIEV